MKSYIPTPKAVRVYAIAKRDTGEYLSLRSRENPIEMAEFSNRGVILHTTRQQYVYTLWMRWLTKKGYVRRRPTLAKEPVRYEILQEPPLIDIIAVDLHPAMVFQMPAHPDDYPLGSGR